MVTVTVTFKRLNPKTPSAWDATAAAYAQSTGKDFEALPLSEQVRLIRERVAA